MYIFILPIKEYYLIFVCKNKNKNNNNNNKNQLIFKVKLV